MEDNETLVGDDGAGSSEMTHEPMTMNSKNDDDDADPVIGEIPVFLTQGEDNDNLYLFQYPVRPAHMPYARETVRGELDSYALASLPLTH